MAKKQDHAFLAELLERKKQDTRKLETLVIFYRKWICGFRTKRNYLIHRVGIYTG